MAKGSGKDVTNRFKEEIMGSLKEAVLSEIRDVAKAAEGESSKTQSQVEDSFEAVGKAAGKGLEKAAKQVERDSAKLEKAISSSFNKINKIKYKEVGKSSGDTLSFLDKFDTSKGLKKVTKKLQQQENEFREAVSGHVNKINGIVSEVWSVDKSEIKFSDISNSLYDKKSALKSANEYISELESSGKKVNNAMSTQIARREALFEALNKNRENRKSYSSLVGVERNEKIAASMLEELKIVKLIHKYTSEIGDKSSYKKALEVDDFGKLRSSISGSLDSMFTDNKALTESFGEMYKSLSMLIDGYHAGLKALQGDDKKAAESILEGLVESTRKTTKRVKDETKDFAKEISEEVKKANNYIDSAKTNASSLSTKKTSKYSTKATFDKPPKNISTGAATEKEYQYVGEVANLLRNTGDKFDTHPGVQYFNALIEKKPELKALADEIKNFKVVTEDVKNVVSGDSSSAIPITDSNKIKVATEEQNRYADALERCKKLGIDISNFTGEVSDSSKIKEATDALEEMIAQAERAEKAGVGAKINRGAVVSVHEEIKNNDTIQNQLREKIKLIAQAIKLTKSENDLTEEQVLLIKKGEAAFNDIVNNSTYGNKFRGLFSMTDFSSDMKNLNVTQIIDELMNKYYYGNLINPNSKDYNEFRDRVYNSNAMTTLQNMSWSSSRRDRDSINRVHQLLRDYRDTADTSILEEIQRFIKGDGRNISRNIKPDIISFVNEELDFRKNNQLSLFDDNFEVESNKYVEQLKLFKEGIGKDDWQYEGLADKYKELYESIESGALSATDAIKLFHKAQKDSLLHTYEATFEDFESFYGDDRNQKNVEEFWKDHLDTMKENEPIPSSFYELSQDDKNRLYKSVGLTDTSEVEENTQAHNRNNDSLAEKLQYLKEIQNHSKFMDTAEDRRISMEDKAWDAGGNNPKSEADSLSKIKKYEEHCEAMEKANTALGEFQDTYESVVITMKDGSEIKITDLYDLDDLKLLKSKIADIKFNPFEDFDFDDVQSEIKEIRTFNKESSGQLAFPIEGVKEASFAIQNAQEEIQSEVKETNDVIEGQINLFDHLNNVKNDDKLKDLQYSVKNQEAWIKSLEKYAGGLSIDEKMSKKEAWENLQKAAERYYDVVNNPKNQYDTMALEKATVLYANAYKQAQVSKVADSRLNQYSEPWHKDVEKAQSTIDKEYKFRQAALNNALIDIIDVKKQIGEDYSEEENKVKTLTDSYVKLRDASIKYVQASNDEKNKRESARNKADEVVGNWDKYNVRTGGFNRYVNTYRDVNREGGYYSDMSAKQITDYLKNFDKSSITTSDYGKLAAYAVRLEEQKKDYKEIFKNVGFDEDLINSESFEEAINQIRQLAPVFEELRKSLVVWGNEKESLQQLLEKYGLTSWAKDIHGFSNKEYTDMFLDDLHHNGFSQKDFDDYIKRNGIKKFEDYYRDADGQLSFTPLKQDEYSILFGENNKKEIEETNEAIEGQISLFDYLDSVQKKRKYTVADRENVPYLKVNQQSQSSTQQTTEEVRELTQAEIEAASKAKDLAKQIASFYGIKTDSKAFQSLETEMKDFIDVLSVDPDTLNPISGIVQSMLGSMHSLRKILGDDIADEYGNMIKEISGNIRIENDMEQSVFGNDNLTFDAVKRMLSNARFSKDGNVSISELLPGFNAKFGTNIEDDGNESNILSRIVEQIQSSKESVITSVYDKMRQDGFLDVVNDILDAHRQIETAEESSTAAVIEGENYKQQEFAETARSAEESANKINKEDEGNNGKLIKTTDSNTEKSRVYQDEQTGRTFAVGTKLNKRGVAVPFWKELTNYTKIEQEAIRYTNQLADAEAKLAEEQRKAKPDTLVLSTLNDQILLLESRIEDLYVQARKYHDEGDEYTYQQFIDSVSMKTDEHAASLAVKTAQQIRSEREKEAKQIEKLEQLKSNYQKKLSSVNSSFSNLAEYKDAQNAINNLVDINDVSEVETALNKLDKVINDFKQNVKSTASLDPVFAAIKKQGNLDNIVEKYRLEFEKLGFSTEEATNEVKKFQELATKINGIDITSKTGMKDFGVELNKFNSEEDHLKNILDITKKRQILQDKINREDNKSYKEKFQVIKDYSDAQDKYNALLAREAKQGSSFELIEEMGNQEKKVKTLKQEAIEASKEITRMFKAGAITKDQKINAQSLLKNVNLEKTDSFNILGGVLDDKMFSHSDEITNVTEEYKKLGFTADEIEKELNDLKEAEQEVLNLPFDASIKSRIDAERSYKEELDLVESRIERLKIAKQDQARQDKINQENAKANEDAYKRQIDAISDYSEAQDKLNVLLGQEVKHGQSEELTAKIKNQQVEVNNLANEAKMATAELVRMFQAGKISLGQKEIGLNLFKDIESGNTDSFKVLAGIKADKAKKDQYAGQTKAYEQLISQMLFGKSIDGVLFKSVSVGETGKTTLTFLESVGEKAREVKYVIDDANDALDEMVNGTFALDPETSSTGKWRNKSESDAFIVDGNEAYNAYLKQKEAYNYLISSEDKYQKLRAKSEAGLLTKNQQAEFNALTKAREKYNNVIQETINLTEKEKKDKFGVKGSEFIDDLSKKYKEKQTDATDTYNAYIDAYAIKDPVELEKINAAIEHTKQLLKEIETSDVSGYDKVFSSANIGIEQLNARLKTGTISVEDYNAEINKICDSLKDTVAVVDKYASDGGMSEMTKYIEGIGGKVVGFNNETKQLTYTIKDHTGAIKTMCIEYEETSGVIKRVNDISKNTESSFNKVTSALKSRLSPLAQYAKNFIDVGSSIQALKKGISVIRDLDVSLTEMRKVSDESLESLKNFQDVSFDIAGSIGTTAKQIQESSADYMRLGFNLNTATELAEDANIYANVGDMDIATATEHMVSSIQAWKSEFGNEIEASEEIIDRYNQIGNNFAITSADIGAAMERSAAALKAGGNTLNESLGLITAGNIIQQDAQTTANALKILSLRIRGAKTDLENMGEETDGLASSTSKMRDEIKALSGVDIMLDENTFKSTAQIIQELGVVYESLSDIQQARLLELIAGKNRASTVSGLLENYEVIGEVIKSAEESDGSAARENQRYLDSIEGKYSQLKNEVQEFWYELISSETIKTFLDFGIKAVDIIGDVIDRMGELGSIMAVLFAHSAANNFLDRILGGEKKPGLLSNILGLFGMKSGKNSGGRVKMFTLIIKYATESFSREVCEFWCTLE